MRTIEGNKLIAEFMGYELADKEYPSDGYWMGLRLPMFMDSDMTEWADTDNGRIRIPQSQLRFHSSWDWLVPVIDKIYSMNDYIKYKDNLGQFADGISINTKFIEVTWLSVVEFIEWNNNQ